MKATPTVTWNSPADITYGTPLGSTQLSASTLLLGSFNYSPIAGTVLNVGTQTLHVDFTPTDSTNYTTASMDVSINVLKATPTITWNSPADIIYGTPLNDIQLDATASVLGSFTYNPPAGTVLNAGDNQSLLVVLTPTDTENYTTALSEVSINVLTPVQKIQQIITLVQSHNLNKGQSNALIVKLNAAVKNLSTENTKAATNELNAFINQVEAYINGGILSSTEGQTLIDEVTDVINAIQN